MLRWSRMMKKINRTPSENATRYELAKEWLFSVFSSSKNALVLYGLVAKEGHGLKKQLRFFVVCDGEIVEVTGKVATLSGFPLYDCYNYFAIYTHRTNMQDIVQLVSAKIYGDTNTIRLERL